LARTQTQICGSVAEIQFLRDNEASREGQREREAERNEIEVYGN